MVDDKLIEEMTYEEKIDYLRQFETRTLIIKDDAGRERFIDEAYETMGISRYTLEEINSEVDELQEPDPKDKTEPGMGEGIALLVMDAELPPRSSEPIQPQATHLVA